MAAPIVAHMLARRAARRQPFPHRALSAGGNPDTHQPASARRTSLLLVVRCLSSSPQRPRSHSRVWLTADRRRALGDVNRARDHCRQRCRHCRGPMAAELSAGIDDCPCARVRTCPQQLLGEASTWLAQQPMRREIVLVSDFPAQALSKADLDRIPAEIGIKLVPVSSSGRSHGCGGIARWSSASDRCRRSRECACRTRCGDRTRRHGCWPEGPAHCAAVPRPRRTRRAPQNRARHRSTVDVRRRPRHHGGSHRAGRGVGDRPACRRNRGAARRSNRWRQSPGAGDERSAGVTHECGGHSRGRPRSGAGADCRCHRDARRRTTEGVGTAASSGRTGRAQVPDESRGRWLWLAALVLMVIERVIPAAPGGVRARPRTPRSGMSPASPDRATLEAFVQPRGHARAGRASPWPARPPASSSPRSLRCFCCQGRAPLVVAGATIAIVASAAGLALLARRVSRGRSGQRDRSPHARESQCGAHRVGAADRPDRRRAVRGDARDRGRSGVTSRINLREAVPFGRVALAAMAGVAIFASGARDTADTGSTARPRPPRQRRRCEAWWSPSFHPPTAVARGGSCGIPIASKRSPAARSNSPSRRMRRPSHSSR